MARKMPKAALKRLVSKVNTELSTSGESGWSVRAYGKEAGQNARDAFAVSLPKQQVEQPIKAPLTTRALTRYQRKFKGLLKQDTWHGGWLPAEGGGTQDVSEMFPRTEEGFKTAYAKGARHQQRAIGEIGAEGEYVQSIDIPTELHSGNEWAMGVPGDVRKPRVEQTPKTVKITPSREEMIDVYSAEEWRKRSEK